METSRSSEEQQAIFLFILYNSLRETKWLSVKVTDTLSAGAEGAAVHTSKCQVSVTTDSCKGTPKSQLGNVLHLVPVADVYRWRMMPCHKKSTLGVEDKQANCSVLGNLFHPQQLSKQPPSKPHKRICLWVTLAACSVTGRETELWATTLDNYFSVYFNSLFSQLAYSIGYIQHSW